jgi:hypothetical protein
MLSNILTVPGNEAGLIGLYLVRSYSSSFDGFQPRNSATNGPVRARDVGRCTYTQGALSDLKGPPSCRPLKTLMSTMPHIPSFIYYLFALIWFSQTCFALKGDHGCGHYMCVNATVIDDMVHCTYICAYYLYPIKLHPQTKSNQCTAITRLVPDGWRCTFLSFS